jgi:hypothetical protein
MSEKNLFNRLSIAAIIGTSLVGIELFNPEKSPAVPQGNVRTIWVDNLVEARSNQNNFGSFVQPIEGRDKLNTGAFVNLRILNQENISANSSLIITPNSQNLQFNGKVKLGQNISTYPWIGIEHTTGKIDYEVGAGLIYKANENMQIRGYGATSNSGSNFGVGFNQSF